MPGVIGVARDLRFLRALVLGGGSVDVERKRKLDELEDVLVTLPFATDFDSDLDALVDILCAPLIVDAELKNIPVPHGASCAFGVGRAQTDVVEECPAAALGIANIELAASFNPDLGVCARNDFGLECDLACSSGIGMSC